MKNNLKKPGTYGSPLRKVNSAKLQILLILNLIVSKYCQESFVNTASFKQKFQVVLEFLFRESDRNIPFLMGIKSPWY